MAKVPQRKLTITDSFMFHRVMHDEKICVGLLERVLGFPVERIVYQNTEQVLDDLPDSKGIQLDLYVKDVERVYNVEMQVEKKEDLPKRLRYYQSKLDSDLLPKGSRYADLRESYVIFLCAHDPFDDKIPVYTVERICLETGRIVKTDAHWLVFNCRAWQRAENEGLRNLLQYIENGRVAEDDDLLSAMDEAVAEGNADRKWVNKVRGVMTMYEDAEAQGFYAGRREGRERGLAEGHAEGHAEGLVEGEALGEGRYAELAGALAKAGRIGDIERAATDKDYRKQLLEEFSLA